MAFRQRRMRLRSIGKAVPVVCVAFGTLTLIILRVWFKFSGPSRPSLLWSRAALYSCLSLDCLHHKAFVSHRLSFEDAEISLQRMRKVLADRPFYPPSEPSRFLEKAKQSTCAVIGGAPLHPSVSAMEQSRLIEQSADLVFRLNVRVPELLAAEGSASSLGTRTDALFLQRGSLRSFERYIHGWGEGNATRGTVRKLASQAFQDRWHPVFIFRHECPSRFESCPNAWEALGRSSLPEWTELHLLHFEVEMLTNKLLKKVVDNHFDIKRREFHIGSDVPSTGIVAVVAAVQMCNAVNIFMFNSSVEGDGDVPGQAVWAGHNLGSERKLLRWLATCPREEAEICGKLTIYS